MAFHRGILAVIVKRRKPIVRKLRKVRRDIKNPARGQAVAKRALKRFSLRGTLVKGGIGSGLGGKRLPAVELLRRFS